MDMEQWNAPATTPIERGQLLRQIMDAGGYTIASLAQRIGATSATVAAWLNGGRTKSGYDVLSARPAIAQKLVSVINATTGWGTDEITDYFCIPVAQRGFWVVDDVENFPQKRKPALPIIASDVSGRVERRGYVEGTVVSRVKMAVEYDPDDDSGLVVAEGVGDRLRIDYQTEIGSQWRVLGTVIAIRPI